MSSGRLNVEPLITLRLPSDRAGEAYDLLVKDRNQLGIVLQYPKSEPPKATCSLPVVHSESTAQPTGPVKAGIIGAARLPTRVLLPALSRTSAQLYSSRRAGGVSVPRIAGA